MMIGDGIVEYVYRNRCWEWERMNIMEEIPTDQ